MVRPIFGMLMILIAVGAIAGTLDKFPGGVYGGLALGIAGICILSCGMGGAQGQR